MQKHGQVMMVELLKATVLQYDLLFLTHMRDKTAPRRRQKKKQAEKQHWKRTMLGVTIHWKSYFAAHKWQWWIRIAFCFIWLRFRQILSSADFLRDGNH